MSHKVRNPYKPLRVAVGLAEAKARCPRWRMVTVVLDATCPGRPWPKQAFQVWWVPPPAGTPGDGPPAWCEADHTGASAWRDGTPPAPVGVVCDQDWRPVEFTTPGGHCLPRLGRDAEEPAT